MSPPICLQCGCKLKAYQPGRYARCDNCYSALAKRPAAFTIPDNAIARATYFPGFAEDLTTWDTVCFDNGSVIQSIRWSPAVHGKDRQPELKAQLNDARVAQLHDALALIDLASLAVFKQWMCVVDAPFVNIFSPRHNLHVTVDQFGLDDEDLPEAAKAGVQQFQAAWELLDSFSPHTIAEHYR